MMIRKVVPADIPVFYIQQAEPTACEMAGFPARDRAAHEAHWDKILADESNIARTIAYGDAVIGNVVSFLVDGERDVGYWIGREYWSQGYATRALAEYIAEVCERPLYARVVEHNTASQRVLAKCGFSIVGEEHSEDGIKGVVLKLTD